jgi:hypothetical protein
MRAAGNVRGVQERGALEAELHECRLHAGQHTRHFALVDVADEPDAARALDLHLLQHAAVDERGAHLARRRVDEDFAAFHHAARAVSQNLNP